ARVIENFRSDDARRRSAPAALVPLDPEATPVATDFVALGDQPALVAVAAIRVASNRAGVNQLPVLVALVDLDRRLMGVLERTSAVEGLRINTVAEPGRELQSLLDRQGRIVTWLSWDTRRPILQVVRQLTPFFALVAAFFVGFAWYAIRQVGHAT